MNETALFIYLWGLIVTFFAVVEEFAWRDDAAAMIVAAFWPILLPARLLRKLLTK